MEYAATLSGTGEISWRDSSTGTVTYSTASWTTGHQYSHQADSSIKIADGDVSLYKNNFTIVDGNSRKRTGLHVASGGTARLTGLNVFSISGKNNNGTLVDGGTLNTSGTNTYKITSGSENNGIEIASGTVKMRGTTDFDKIGRAHV